MNWPNAKNLTLVFLVILNIFLGVLVFANRTNYKLTPEAERSILKLLADNHITLLMSVPKDYAPMSQLLMTPCPEDIYLGIFFPGQPDLRITLEYDKTIYKTDTAALVLQNGGAIFTPVQDAGDPGRILDEKAAVGLCDAFLKAGQADDFELDRYAPIENGYRLEYRQINKQLVFSNYFIFDVTSHGITSIRGKYDQSAGYENGRKDIISADRALFVLTKYLIGEYENTEIKIQSIDIVYIQPETSVNSDASLRAAPYYRFYYSENDLPLLINAYTGAIFDYVY